MIYEITKEDGNILLANENSFISFEVFGNKTLTRLTNGNYNNIKKILVSESGGQWRQIYNRGS